jgi:5-methylcytosine-specific restriction endonuclease McrA
MKKLILFIFLIPSLLSAGEYKRSDWPHWKDLDGDCQDARSETLLRDSLGPTFFKTVNGCKVVFGEWLCPYTGKTFFLASDIEIDHIVPLANAHRSGAANWSREQKKAFANDPDNLFTVGYDVKQSKGNKDPEEWRPPLKSYWTKYALYWSCIKEKYGLGYATGELEALEEMLGGE